MASLTYKDAGVDIDRGDALVERIKPLAEATRTPGVLGSVGGFAGLFQVPGGMTDPVLVSGTDGVGTKLKLAFETGRHDTIGIDLVAMCVNDIATTGARPLFFLDYYGTSELDVDTGEAVVRGISEGCRQAGCALLGGETAELPGFYRAGEYDLAGFAVGVVERNALIDGSRVKAGDAIVGVASTGLHSNGFSLARKALLERAGLALDASPEGGSETLGSLLLSPTRIYVAAIRAALDTVDVRALCHVTGGGLPGNLPRVLPKDLGAEIDEQAIPTPRIFDLIRRHGNVAVEEMRRTFNLGVGLCAVVPETQVEACIKAFGSAGDDAFLLGRISSTAGVRYP
ncbi:MAG: phosphoribosylformylglycinamidine cyclo-ligase [Myxococcota bacterium]